MFGSKDVSISQGISETIVNRKGIVHKYRIKGE